MSADDLFTLARLDYELHAGPWPLERDVTERYIATVHRGEQIDRHLLMDVLGEYIGSFALVSDFARTLTAQSVLDSSLPVGLTDWPFRHIDWEAAGAALESSIADDGPGTIMRFGTHYFAPTPAQ